MTGSTNRSEAATAKPLTVITVAVLVWPQWAGAKKEKDGET
jgi:hypothetical protein